MHWWQGAFTSTSTKPQSEDESVIAAGDGASAKSGFFSSRRNRLITRARKLRQVAENEVDNWRSLGHFQIAAARAGSPSSAPPSPQPLPLPELRVLLQRDPKFASSPSSSCCSVPLPSPGDIPNTRGCGDDNERERDREREMMEATNAEPIDGTNGLNRLAGQDARTNSEHSEMQPSRESLQMQYTKDHSSENYNISMTNSAPATPHSSHELSPRNSDTPATQYRTHPGVFQTWSAPDAMPQSDGNLNLGFSYQEKSASIVDSLTSFPSPSNSQATVHPLPLPPMASQLNSMSSPGPSTPSQSTSISSHTPKPEYPVASSITAQLSPISPAESIQELVPRKSQWQKGKLIGRGTFGSVYVASNRETGALCAMKEVDILPDDSKSAECMRQLEQEIKVLSHLKHPNIVQYYGSEIVGDKFYIYLEYVHPGSINKFIQDHCGAITESVVRNFTRHILCGLAYLHSKKTIHRDIKGANLLVDAYGVVKLADFGMAKHLNGQTANLSLKGSPYWMAPELMQSAMQADASSDTALAVDIWSLGCTIVEMMDGKPPFSEYEGAAALFKVLKETPPIPETLSEEGKDFLQCCFRRNPAERPTASKLLDHPFLSQSHQHEASTQSLSESKFMDNTPLLRERPRHKLELPLPLGTQMKKGNSSNNDNNQRSHLQAAHLAATLPSPRSILEALPTLPLPSPERCLEKNINSSNIVLSSLKHAANI